MVHIGSNQYILEATLSYDQIDLITKKLKTQSFKLSSGLVIDYHDLMYYIHNNISIPKTFFCRNDYTRNYLSKDEYIHTFSFWTTKIETCNTNNKDSLLEYSNNIKEFFKVIINQDIKTKIHIWNDPDILTLKKNIHFKVNNRTDVDFLTCVYACSKNVACDKCGFIIEKSKKYFILAEHTICIFCGEDFYEQVIKPSITEEFNKEDINAIQDYRLAKKLI
jgi:hypothetical protein